MANFEHRDHGEGRGRRGEFKYLVRRSDLARALGISISTVTYYTKEGLFSVAGKTPGGMTLYNTKETEERFLRIKEMKEQGATLREIKEDVLVGV